MHTLLFPGAQVFISIFAHTCMFAFPPQNVHRVVPCVAAHWCALLAVQGTICIQALAIQVVQAELTPLVHCAQVG